jgi:hypothetical protein
MRLFANKPSVGYQPRTDAISPSAQTPFDAGVTTFRPRGSAKFPMLQFERQTMQVAHFLF